MGNRALRDPFIGFGPDGVYHLLATDGWASPAILHAVSADLSTWSSPELIPVMSAVPGGAQRLVLEFFYVPDRQCYQLIWSSAVDPADTDG